MENQDTNFLGGGFGIQASSAIDSDVADLLFGGGSPSTDPNKVQPINKTQITKIDEDASKEIIATSVEVDAEDLLDNLGAISKEKTDIEKPTTTPKEDTITEDEDDSNTFSTLSKNLVDLGIFSQKDDEKLPATGEEFKDKWIAERQEQVNSDIQNFLVSKHGEEGLKVFEDIFVKGVSPKEYLSKFSELQSMRDLDLTQEMNQERVVRESLRRQGLKDEIIDKKIQKLKDYGDLEEEAPIAHELIMRQEEEELQEITEQKASEEINRKRQKAEYQNNLQKLLADKIKAKEFDGIPITDKVVRETYDYLDTEKWQLPSGEKLTDFDKDILELRDPKNIELKLKMALLLKNKLDLSKIKTNLVSKESNRYFEDLVIKDKHIKRTSRPVTSGDSFFSGL